MRDRPNCTLAAVLTTTLAASAIAQPTPVREHAAPFGWDEEVPRGVVTDSPTGWGNACWQGPTSRKANYHIMFEDQANGLAVTLVDLFGPNHGITVGDLAKLSFLTKKDGTIPASHDWWFTIYTQPEDDGQDSGTWYDSRLHARPDVGPGYSPSYTAGVWNLWSTTAGDSGTNQLLFYDSNRPIYSGYYSTLSNLAAGPVDWDGDMTTDHDYSGEVVRMITIQTDSGWDGFDGLIDGITIELTDGSVGEVDLGGPVYNPDSDTSYLSIQDAIDDLGRGRGATINVGPGTYEEQLHITVDDLTITGSGSGDDPVTSTIILSPVNLTWFYTTSADNYPVVGIDGATGVTIENLRVDGDDRGDNNYRFQGVAFWNSGGTLQDCVVANVMNSTFSGAQHGVGVYAFNDTLGPYTVYLTNVEVPDYQKGGIAMNGDGLTAHVKDCTTIGQGPTTVTAQNGIQFYGSSGTITDCYVEGNIYTGGGWAASGVLLIDGPQVDMTGTDIVDNGVNVYCLATNCDADDITVTNTLADAGTGFYSRIESYGLPLLTADEDLTPIPSPFGDYQPPADAGGRATMTVSVADSTFVSDGTSYAISCSNYSATDTIVADVHNCTIDTWEWGFVVFDSAGGVNNIALTAGDNIVTDTPGGFYSALSGQTATYNWWGAPAGPDDPDGSVAADLGNCADVSQIYNVSPYGAFVSDLNVEYCPWLGGSGTMTLAVDDVCLSDTQITVTLSMSDLSYFVTGYQAFVAYDDSVLGFDPGLSDYNVGAPYNQHINDLTAGDQIISGLLLLDGNDLSGVGTDADTDLAVLTFDVLAPCALTEVEFDLYQGFASELSYLGEPLATALVDTIQFKLDSTAPVVTGPGNIDVNADAGTCEAVVELTASATDNCDTINAGDIIFTIDVDGDGFDGDDDVEYIGSPSSHTFPLGVTTVRASATDGCGNTGFEDFTVTVNAVNDVQITVALPGSTAPVTRCIHFVTDDCDEYTSVLMSFIDHDANSSTPVQASATVEVPCGLWSNLCVKDEQHTLWTTVGITDAGTFYTANAVASLEGGDTDNDGDVDINDVTWLLFQWSLGQEDGGCPWNGTRDADFSNNNNVGSEDYLFISDNWLTQTSCACTSAMLDPDDPEVVFGVNAVLTADLPGYVGARVDMNADGIVNVRDVEIFEALYQLDGSLSDAMRSATARPALRN
jgi:hypothetical protein